MQESKSQGGRFRRGGGKKAASTQAGGSQGVSRRGRTRQSSALLARSFASASEALRPTTNAPLEIAVPNDTPSFNELKDLIHPLLLTTITQDMKFGNMTPVQAATIFDLLNGRKDVLAQAKTGTGKTVAFLLPAIQSLIQRKPKPGKHVSLLVISPTRELAMQIASDAQKLLGRMPQYKVRVAIGGTNKKGEQNRFFQGCDILVGTPGRLYDHMTGEEDGDPVEFRAKLQSLDTLVLDEADRLLDMGFLKDLKQIIAQLPTKERQGMLFSATLGNHVQQAAHLALSPGYKFISTIQEGEAATHDRVPQTLITVPEFSDMAAALVGALRHEIGLSSLETFKTIIFAPTSAHAEFYAGVLSRIKGMPTVSALHSRLSQSRRTKTTNEFRTAKAGIVVATDVIARGMDFPSVTNVIQAGVPMDRESYIHRLGRTARAGAEGRGTFIVTSHEAFFPQSRLKDINFQKLTPDLSSQSEVSSALEGTSGNAKLYGAWLGYYKGYIKPLGWSPEHLVEQANQLALNGLGLSEIPGLQRSTISKMQLKGVRGLVIAPPLPMQARGGGGGRGRRSGAAEASSGGGYMADA